MSRAQSLFQPPTPAQTATATNHEGYPAFERSVEDRFVQTLLTNTLGQTYYSTSRELLAEAEAVHLEMIAKDPEFAAKAIVFARNKGFMRTQPIFALSLLSTVPGPHFAWAFPQTIRTPSDLSDFASMIRARRNGEGGRKIKRVAGDWLAATLNQYWAIKYGAEKGQDAYSLKDLLQVYHPRFNAPSVLVDYLMKRPGATVDLSSVPQLGWFERLKLATDDETKIAAVNEGRLPHEITTPFAGNSKAMWCAIVAQMPIFALLKNLATIERHGVMEEMREHIISTLTNPAIIRKSMILPFRFVEAEKHVRDQKVKDALRDAVELSFDAVPDIEGSTAVLLDVSPSMKPPYRTDDMMMTAATFAVAIMKKARGNGELIVFDGQAKRFPVSMRDSLLTQASQVTKCGSPEGGTNPTAALNLVTDRFDNVIIITDGEQNQGAPFANTVAKYRQAHSAGKNIKLFEVDVSPNLNAITKPTDKNTWAVYGWSDQALQFISMTARGYSSVVDEIRSDKGARA